MAISNNMLLLLLDAFCFLLLPLLLCCIVFLVLSPLEGSAHFPVPVIGGQPPCLQQLNHPWHAIV
jgi:hypothetical protein